MSVIVFPQTDAVCTIANFSSVKTAVDRGEADQMGSPPIVTGTAVEEDLPKIRTYQGHANGPISSNETDWEKLFSIQIDQSEHIVIDWQGAFRLFGSNTVGDALSIRFTTPTGVRLIGGFMSGESPTLASSYYNYLLRGNVVDCDGTTQTFAPAIAAFTNAGDARVLGLFVAYGNSASGEILCEFSKTTDNFGQSYRAAQQIVVGRRIFG